MIWTLSLAAKSTVVLGAATLVAWRLGRSSASTRHAVWHLAVLSLVALPVLSAVLPPLGLPLLPAPVPDVARHQETVGGLEARQAPLGMIAALPSSLGWQDWVLLAWLAGASVLLIQLGCGWLFVALVVRRARPVTAPGWSALLEEAVGTLGVRQQLELRVSRAVDVASVWGHRRPVVMLPAAAASWPEGRRRAILLHEVAHVARNDWLTQTLAYVVRAFYWPHPLVWWAVSSLRRESERACDDRVLHTGTAAPDYARHLIEAARGLARPASRVLATSAGAEPTRLGNRVVAVLDEDRDRRVPTRRGIALSGAGTLLAIAILAAAEPVAARTAEGASRAHDSTETAPSEWIAHEPFGCLIEGRYAEIDATVEPASEVAEARLYFASAQSDEGIEYWVEMTRDGSRVVGRLPKPRAEASPVWYRIEARRTDGRVASTERYVVVAAATESRCPEDARIAPRASSTEAVTVHSSVSR
jgi:beta-lactamase regulating signal transducer with metallopeptidase domain